MLLPATVPAWRPAAEPCLTCLSLTTPDPISTSMPGFCKVSNAGDMNLREGWRRPAAATGAAKGVAGHTNPTRLTIGAPPPARPMMSLLKVCRADARARPARRSVRRHVVRMARPALGRSRGCRVVYKP